MATRKRTRINSFAPVIRRCALCGEARAIMPINEDHKKALLARQVDFVCQDCADQVRIQVEAAGTITGLPQQTA
ncbi:MAG TPA: hypothetical protein VD973_29940 [Symbiobacteriaceae bacterium]|nr:hypothetical protein [Symbiobacteriaceae bacterium]